jgi:hypothetical protein
MKTFLTTLPAMALGTLTVFAALASPDLDSAKDFFSRYTTLEQRFDPELAELYSDKANIKVTRVYSTGVVRQLLVPGELYKLAIRQSMAAAKETNDFNRYTDVQYTAEADKVRITATRYSQWQDYRSPYSMLLARDADSRWMIVEETVETHVPGPPPGSGEQGKGVGGG